MKKYIVSRYRGSDGVIFYCLYLVERTREENKYSIKEVLVDNSKGRMTFSNCEGKVLYCWTIDNIYQDVIHVSALNSLMDFNSNEEALLWFKLNY